MLEMPSKTSACMQHGFASRNGLTAAALAASGYVGIKRVFEREYGGWLSTFGEGHHPDPGQIYADLGTLWETDRVAVKAYAAMMRAPVQAAIFKLETLTDAAAAK